MLVSGGADNVNPAAPNAEANERAQTPRERWAEDCIAPHSRNSAYWLKKAGDSLAEDHDRLTDALAASVADQQTLREALGTTLGHLHVINHTAGLIERFKDDPNLDLLAEVAHIRKARLAAHEALAAVLARAPAGPPDQGER